MLPRWPGLTATHMRALRKNCVSPGSLKAISANRYTDRACHPEHFWIAARCAACSHTPSASGCPHRVNLGSGEPFAESPLYPDQRTSSDRADWSASCQPATSQAGPDNERGRQLRRPYFRVMRPCSRTSALYRSIWPASLNQLEEIFLRTSASCLLCANFTRRRHSAA